MYAKFLFVGLGGSGGKTLRFLKHELHRWQNEHNVARPLPRGWQFVNIDTPNVADGAELDELVDPLTPGEYVGLIDSAITFKAVQESLDVKPGLHYDLCGWRPDPAGPAGSVPLLMGAGQFRAIGQTVALAYASRINNELTKCMDRLTEPETDPELGELYKQATGNDPDTKSNIYVVVISSLAGGTGAGLLNTVCDVLRATRTPDDAGSRVFALLYTPDVFDSLTGAVTDGVQANTLASVSELINATWRSGHDPIPLPDPTLSAAGLVVNGFERGPAFPFLVGRQNADGVNFGTPERTFEMTGRSLVSWATDISVQRQLIAYTIGNFTQSSLNQPMNEILVDAGGDAKGLPLFSALGFSRVSLGTDYLEDYIIKRVARDAHEHLADYHLLSDEAQRVQRDLGTADADQLARAIAEEYRDSFLREAGLSEYGPDENQIIDALPPDEALEEEFVQSALKKTSIGHGDRKSLHDWVDEITHAVEQSLTSYERDYQDALAAKIREWVPTIEAQVLDALERQIASRGLRVATAMCDLAAEHLVRDVTRDLRDEATLRRDWQSSWKRAPRATLEGLEGRIDADNHMLERSVRDAVHLAKYVGEESLLDRSADLCEEIAQRLLSPLARALRDAGVNTGEEKRATQAWPAWNDARPSKAFEPPVSEFAVIDTGEFPEHFSARLEQTFPQQTAESRRVTVRDAIVIGEFLKSEPGMSDLAYSRSRCIAVQNHWWPRTERPLDPSRNPARIAARVQTSTDDLRHRAKRWLRRRGTPFERLINHGIRSYLGDGGQFGDDFNEAEIQRHRTRFLAQLNAAMKASGPLVSIDRGLLGKVHPGTASKSHRRSFSQIPLQGHPAENRLREVLSGGGVADAAMKDLLTSSGAVKHVDVTSVLHAPHSILVMKSLTDPVAGAWNKAKTTPAGLDNFWKLRTGRRLDKFVPVPQPLLLCMIRGWFTGIALGRIDKGSRGQPVRILRDGNPNAAPFPYPLLSQIIDNDDTLACVLETLGLAYIEVGAIDSLTPLDAYKELRDLGLAGDGRAKIDLYEYDEPSHALQRWIDNGRIGERLVDPLLRDSGSQTPDERAQRLSELFEEARSDFGTRYDTETRKWAQDAKHLSRAPRWTGLWQHMGKALEQLSAACGQEVPAGRGMW